MEYLHKEICYVVRYDKSWKAKLLARNHTQFSHVEILDMLLMEWFHCPSGTCNCNMKRYPSLTPSFIKKKLKRGDDFCDLPLIENVEVRCENAAIKKHKVNKK